MIKDCKQAGGVMLAVGGQGAKKQAWALLTERFEVLELETPSDWLTKLLAMRGKWPKDVTAAAFSTFYNTCAGYADRCQLNPTGDSMQAIQLREMWWQVVSAPQSGNGHWPEMVRLVLGTLYHQHQSMEQQQWYYTRGW